MVHSSCCSARMAPTSRITEASSGKICTTLARRFTSLLSRSSGLFDQIFRQCSGGNAKNARTSALAAVLAFRDAGELFREEFRGVIPGSGDGGRVGVHEHHPERCGDHVLVAFRDALQEVAGEMELMPNSA